MPGLRSAFLWILAAVLLPGMSAGAAETPRVAVPDAEAAQTAETAVRARYHQEFSAARKPPERRALARRLVEADASQEDPAACYARLRLALTLAQHAGDAETIAAAIRQLGQRFEVDAGKLRHEALAAAVSDAARPPSAARDLAESCLACLEAAVADDHFAEAIDFGRAAYAAAGKARDAALVERIAQRGREVVAQEQAYAGYVDAAQVRGKTPDDTAACLRCGLYLGLYKADWTQALPLLAQGNDPQWQARARADLHPQATPHVELGDAWWKLAEGQEGAPRHALRERAAFWYRQALPELTGLAKTRVTLRLAQIKGFGHVSPPATETTAAEARTPATPPGASAAGEWIDLAPLVRPGKDIVAGAWRVQGSGVQVASSGAVSRLVLPLVPKESYDLQIGFTRTAGNGAIGVFLPVGTAQCLAALGVQGMNNGIDTIGGERADHNASTFPAAINSGRAYAMEIAVRVRGNEATITVNVDQRPWIFYRGAVGALRLADEWKSARPAALGLAAQCDVNFHVLRFRKVSGTVQSLK